jgi:uncharacterized lipoprotein YehR (DUF1307 family)
MVDEPAKAGRMSIMVKFLNKIMTVLAVVVIAVAYSGCKDTTKTKEVNGKLLGGTEVKEKTVTESDNKATVTEKKTEYDANGNKIETNTKTTGNSP